MRLKVPTTLSKESNTTFRKMYKEHFNTDLTVEEANEEAHRVMSFLAIIIENTDEFRN